MLEMKEGRHGQSNGEVINLKNRTQRRGLEYSLVCGRLWEVHVFKKSATEYCIGEGFPQKMACCFLAIWYDEKARVCLIGYQGWMDPDDAFLKRFAIHFILGRYLFVYESHCFMSISEYTWLCEPSKQYVGFK